MNAIRKSLAVGVAAWLATAGQAAALDGLGTAGPLRSAGWADCAASYAELMQGACDPAPVDETLPSAQRSEAHRKRSIDLVAIVRMDEARKAVNEALKADPTNTAALLLRARLAIDGPGDSAAADVNLGLMLAPSDPNLLATRAYLLHDDNKSELALRDANAAVTLDSDNPDARWVRAVILMKRRQLDAAEHDLTHALLVEPTGLRTRTFRAMVRLRANRYRDAIEDATGVLQQSPSNPDVLQVRAISRMALGENEGAIADLNRILGEPGEPSTAGPAMGQFRQLFLQRAVVSARIGRPGDAMRDLETVINFGGRPALLALQVHLRRHGFRDLPLDGKRTPALDDAAQACFVNQACGRGLAVRH